MLCSFKRQRMNQMATVMCKHLWESISSGSVIKAWGKELKQLSANVFDSSEWAMVGHGVVIEHDYPLDFKAYLTFIARDLGFAVVALDSEKVMDPELLANAIKTDVPTIIYLEPGYWVSDTISEDEDRGFPIASRRDEELAARMRQSLVDHVFKDILNHPVVLVVSLKQTQQLDESLRATGLFDRKIKFPHHDRQHLAEAFIKVLGQDQVDQSILQQGEQVGLMIEEEYADLRRCELMMTALKRLAWRQKRKVSLRDLVEITIYGTIEEDQIALDPDSLRESAIHEAGHAVMGYLDSGNFTAPIYCAVGKRGDLAGVVMRQCNSYKKVSNNETFQECIHAIRVCLAGRVAEELVLGIDLVSGGGASEDLKEANRQSNRLFARWGYPVQNGTEHIVGSNVAVVIGQPSHSEYQYIESLVRDFLQQQYQAVMATLTEHRGFLEFIANAIAGRGILLQTEFEALALEWYGSQEHSKAA